MRNSRRRSKTNVERGVHLIGILIIIVLIVIIGKLITNRKEATDVTTSQVESGNSAASTSVEGEKEKNESWKIGNNNTSNTSEVNSTTNTNIEENKVTNTESNETNQSAVNNTTAENNTTDENNTTEDNNTTNTTTTKKSSSDSNPIYSERQGTIYLSFDDGPSSNITPKVLDILKEEGIKATFFVLNFSDENAHLVKREVEEGHTIGIHGYSHEYSKIYRSKEAFMSNVYDLQAKIKETTGVTSMYVRFPGGSSNTVSRKYSKGIMTALSKELLSKGFKYYDWNVCAEDAGSAKNSKDVYNYVVKYLKKDRQNMVLMHDFASNKKGLDALRDIIKFGKKNGYKFMAVDDKTPMFAQHINN